MNKKLLLVVLVIVAVIGASMTYVLLQKSGKDMTVQSDKASQDNAKRPEEDKQPAPLAAKGSYVDYSADLFNSTQGTRLLFFHAPWCPQCRALDESIKSSELPDGVTIFKVDYDSNQTLRAKYGVTLQTTVVKVDDAGNKLAGYVAYDEPSFQSVKQALLP